MCTKHWTSNRALLLGMVGVLAGSESAGALEMEFFNRGIDYWKASDLKAASPSEPATAPSNTATPQQPKPEASPSPARSFPWKQYLDPKNKEFFREGDYTPPEPFMEIARDPSDSNLKLWFEYIAKKNELSDRLEKRMQDYLAENGAVAPVVPRNDRKTHTAPSNPGQPDIHRFRFRLYFDSHCAHCKRMFGTMKELQERGYFVEARQVDNDHSALAGIPIPVLDASAAELQSKAIQSVPVLFIGDLKKKVVYRLNGFQTEAQVLGALPKEEKEP